MKNVIESMASTKDLDQVQSIKGLWKTCAKHFERNNERLKR